MLFVLSGNIQTGKTRFLCDLLGTIEKQGTVPFGVVAPGVWRDESGNVSISGGFSCATVDAFDWAGAPADKRDKNGFEKLGICNTLIPREETMLFAVRRDIAQVGGLVKADSQSEKSKLFWYAFDDVIERENAYFERAVQAGVLAAAQEVATGAGAGKGGLGSDALTSEQSADVSDDGQGAEASNAKNAFKQALLVVDELGRMELLNDSGLTSAMALLDAGPQPGCPHALIVVREPLSGLAELRFGHKWNGYITVYPDNEDSVNCLLSTLRVSLAGLDKPASTKR